MYRLLFLLPLIFIGCSSEWYLTKSVTISDRDIPNIRLDSNKSSIENIREIQRATRYNWRDFWFGTAYGVTEGMGLGFYETKVFYGKRAFPGSEGAFWDWYRMETSGDAWLKVGHPDKVFRAIWMVSNKASWNRYLKFYGGNWIYAYLTEFTISNSVAGLIRKFGKYGEFTFNINIDWQILDGIFDNL